jgi:hypothetical protein
MCHLHITGDRGEKTDRCVVTRTLGVHEETAQLGSHAVELNYTRQKATQSCALEPELVLKKMTNVVCMYTLLFALAYNNNRLTIYL